jgi:hypothetical protein
MKRHINKHTSIWHSLAPITIALELWPCDMMRYALGCSRWYAAVLRFDRRDAHEGNVDAGLQVRLDGCDDNTTTGPRRYIIAPKRAQHPNHELPDDQTASRQLGVSASGPRLFPAKLR